MPNRILLALLAVSIAGCAMAREPSKTPRTAIEQLLLAQAIDRSLRDLRVPIPDGSTVALDVAGFSNYTLVGTDATASTGAVYGSPSDLAYARDVVAGRLGELGHRILSSPEGAGYRIKVIVQALGTEQGDTFFGMPAVQSVLIPFALPELTLYREQDQMGYMRYSLNVYEAASGRLVRSTPWYLGTAYYNQYTVLFFLRFKRTDLTFPP